VHSTEESSEKHRKARLRNVRVLERIEGHYETEKVPFGWVYRWCTEGVVAECGCGEKMTLTCSVSTCPGCATEHAAVVQEWLPTTERAADEADEALLLRPWRRARDRDEGESLPY